MDSRTEDLIWGAFAGDALALGVHWIYNPAKIYRLHGRVTDFIAPEVGGYHDGKGAGDFTHYGDQTMVLLRSVAECGGFRLDEFAERWRTLWPSYRGYIDGATRETVAHFSEGLSPSRSGSSSNDLAGASRLAPLFFAFDASQEAELIAAAREQAAMTHGDGQVIDAAEYFVRVIIAIQRGLSVADAIDEAATIEYRDLPAPEWLEQARALMDEETVPALQQLGLTCHVPEAFPATLFLLLKYADNLEDALIDNVMAGGDSAARGLLVGAVLGAALGRKAVPRRWITELTAHREISELIEKASASRGAADDPQAVGSADESPVTEKMTFANETGEELAGRLERPAGAARGVAIFAHCFTCSKDVAAATRVSRGLAARGIAVLRFDFTGLGNSAGDFANTNFSSNVDDLVAAAEHLRAQGMAPSILIGHSLGGAAVLAAAERIPEVAGVVTIGAPASPEHVTHLLASSLDDIESEGVAQVSLAGRPFTIKKQFLQDLREQDQRHRIETLSSALLVMHSPVDEVVGIENARLIYEAAKHPKSFLSLDRADHLLTRQRDSEYVAEMIAAWSSRVLDAASD